jgi:hypothetical protein
MGMPIAPRPQPLLNAAPAAQDAAAKAMRDLRETGDPLMEIIQAGDVEKARAFFDKLFWAGQSRKPEWEHLQLALLGENKPMLRFLVARGAAGTPENLGELKSIAAEKFSYYAGLLRQAGLRVPEPVSESPASARLKVGDKLPDGTIYAGLSPDTQRPMYAAAADASLAMDFNAAAEYASKSEAHDHKDWRVPTKEELNLLYQNKNKGFLKGSFGAVYWSSTEVSYSTDFACEQVFFGGHQDVFSKGHRYNLRCVRG